jgi:pyruvate ferredoxin oxidoreductase delta subunit
MTRVADREVAGPVAWLRTRGSNEAARWRNQRPVLEPHRCNGCMVCWKFCPEPAVEMQGKLVRFALDACKGCGVCAEVCAPKAITMVPEGL